MTTSKLLVRLGTLCSVVGILAFISGCPLFSDPCNGFQVEDDNNPCTTDSCDVVNGAATSVHTPIANCCEAASDCADDDACTLDTCSNINTQTGVGTCTHTGIGQNCCNDTCDCELTEVCTDNVCVTGTRDGNENCNDNTNGNDNGNTNGNDNGNGGDAAAGQAFYTAHGCAGCHGADASGGVGPNIQGETADEITQTLTGGSHPITVDITAQEAADLAAYLATF